MVVPAFVNGKPVEFKIHQEGLPADVEARFGITAQQCRANYEARLLVNAAYYKELENHVPDHFPQRLLGGTVVPPSSNIGSR